MTARDDVVAIIEAFIAQEVGFHVDIMRAQAEDLLDAVPPRVLAQLAIDTGALKRSAGRFIMRPDGKTILDPDMPLYKLVDEDGGSGGS